MEYKISNKRHNENLYDIELKFTTPVDNPILEMPSWSPGSYLIRDYARHVQEFHVKNKKWRKVKKNNWLIEAKKGELIVVNYAVYAFDLTVRTSYLDNRKGLISPGTIFFYIISDNYNSKNEPIAVNFDLVDNWKVFTSLKYNEKYIAKNFDELIDSPYALGIDEVLDVKNYSIKKYGDKGDDIPCTLVIIGDKGNHNIDSFVNDLIKIQKETIRIFGELPYDRYLWALYIVGKGGGGLEHKYSNFSIIPRFQFKDPKKYQRLLSLEAHEHFHVFNVKRIRASQLGPFDYSNEVYVKILWQFEGFTSFYDDIYLVRSKLIDEKSYFDKIGNDIFNLDSTPGRKLYSLEESSFDAWIKLYKPDENTPNSYVSYYLKGGIVSMMLDIEIRMQTNNTKSLDDYLVYMYKRYKKDGKGFDENKVREFIEEATGTDLKQFFNKYITGVDDIDYNHYLNYIGYELKKEIDENNNWTGIKYDKNNIVTLVYSNSPGREAGIFVKDELIAVNGFKFSDEFFKQIITESNTNDILSITLFRDNKLMEVKLKLAPPKPTSYKIIKSKSYDDPKITMNRKLFFNY